MSKSEKLFKILSSLAENGILTTMDAKNEILNNLKFKKDNFLDKLQLVSREEFEVLKKIVQKQEKEIEKLKKKKLKR
ncbi:MAG: accessory factor UbiK family protein [Pelagibacteraceae bacterium]|tara:strand:+ start:346 stop:576 length:231 start_codon:yes stop_codon:yes gene_type:complete